MKTFIRNRDNNEICVVVENETTSPHKLAFVMHGLSGRKEELHIRGMAEVLMNNGYTVVTWDAIHTFGESKGGLYEDATITNYYADLEDVITWASGQAWYEEPFVLVGHSLGGISTSLYAEKYPEKIKALAPISTAVNGELRMQSKADMIDEWKRTGLLTINRSSGGTKTLKWSHMEDGMQYDITQDAQKLTMPVLLVVGSEDTSTWPEHQQVFYDSLTTDKELHIVQGAEHTYSRPHERDELNQILNTWLKDKVK